MDNQHNQQDSSNLQNEEPRYKWIITDHQANYLMALRQELINQRAYEALNMSQETMYEAAQATGYSLGRLKMIDEILDSAQVVVTPMS